MSTTVPALPQKWQDRFAFFDLHGAPNTPTYKAALKALPSGKMKINFNWLAWLFGPIYFFILGLWKKALVGLAITIAGGVVCAFLPDGLGNIVGRAFGFAMSFAWGMTANYAYYLKLAKGRDDWNFLDGMRW